MVDPDDRLWLLDTGSIEFGPTMPGGPKLLGVNLRTNEVFQMINFPRDVGVLQPQPVECLGQREACPRRVALRPWKTRVPFLWPVALLLPSTYLQ